MNKWSNFKNQIDNLVNSNKTNIEIEVSYGIEYEIVRTGLKGFGYKLCILGFFGREIDSAVLIDSLKSATISNPSFEAIITSLKSRIDQ